MKRIFIITALLLAACTSPQAISACVSSVDWNSVQPGDTVTLCDGTYSTFTVQKSGTVISPITITGNDVTFDGNGASDVFSFGSQQYVKLSNVTVKNGSQLVRMRTSNVIVDNVTFIINGERGVDCRGYNNTIINSYFETVANAGQGDGIWSTGGGGHTFSNNYFRNRNTNDNAHSDAIQLYQETQGSVIANNFIWQDNTKTTNAQGIYIEGTDAGTYDIYNNVLVMPYAKNGVAIRNSQFDANVIGNTFYQTNAISPNLWIRDDGASSVDNIVIKNNIFYSTANNYPLQIEETLVNSEVDGNIFYTPQHSSTPIYYKGATSLSNWNNQSFVGLDYYGDPTFVNAGSDFHLQVNSPAIGKAVVLESPYDYDIDGIKRVSWDIGAYESISSVPPTVTPLPKDCVEVIWLKDDGLHIRESASMSNLGRVGWYNVGAVLRPISVEENEEGVFIEVSGGWVAYSLVSHPNNKYMQWVNCP